METTKEYLIRYDYWLRQQLGVAKQEDVKNEIRKSIKSNKEKLEAIVNSENHDGR